jgi:hypothetical protein
MIIDKELTDAIYEIQQPRSKFQIDHFVLNQHYTPEMQYYQMLLELNSLIYNYNIVELDLEIQKKKLEKLRQKDSEIAILKCQKIILGIQQTENALHGSAREIDYLYNIWKQAPIKYTREQLEAAQPQYWQARLTHDVEMQAMAGAVNPAHLTSLHQAGLLDGFIKNFSQGISDSPDNQQIKNSEV